MSICSSLFVFFRFKFSGIKGFYMCLPFILVSHGLHTLFSGATVLVASSFFTDIDGTVYLSFCYSLRQRVTRFAYRHSTHICLFLFILWFCWLLSGPYTFIPQSYQHFHLKFLFDDRGVYLWIGDLLRLKSLMIPYRTIRSLSEMCIFWRHCGSYRKDGDRR